MSMCVHAFIGLTSTWSAVCYERFLKALHLFLINLASPLCDVQGDSLADVWEHNSFCRFLLVFTMIIALSIHWFTN